MFEKNGGCEQIIKNCSKKIMDKRVTETNGKLKTALFELMKKKSINSITPTDICKKAGVNRNTFYYHYKNPEDLLDTISQDLYNSIEDNVRDNDDLDDVMLKICKTMQKNKSLCKALLGGNSNDFFMNRVMKIIKKHNIDKLSRENRELSELQKEMISDFTIAGALSILTTWIKYDMEESPENISKMIVKLVFSGVNSVR